MELADNIEASVPEADVSGHVGRTCKLEPKSLHNLLPKIKLKELSQNLSKFTQLDLPPN